MTGIGLAIVVFGVFFAGPLALTVLVLVALALAAAEAYAGFRSVGAHPATILGIVAVLTLGIAVYNKGLVVVGAVTVLLVIFGFIWYMIAPNEDRRARRLGRDDLRLRLGWRAGLVTRIVMLAPHTYPNRNGMAFVFGAVALTICNDAGALFIGRWFGSRPLNASLSPNKTIEGTVGGTIVTLIAGALLLAGDQSLDGDPRRRSGGSAVDRGALGRPVRIDGQAHARPQGLRQAPARSRRTARIESTACSSRCRRCTTCCTSSN